MKLKYADRADWKRIACRDFTVYSEDDNLFRGTISILTMKKVKQPLWVQYKDEEQEVCIADDGYIWVQHFPVHKLYVITTVLNQYLEIVQWYVDICREHGVTAEGIPWYEDLYVDVVFLPNGSVHTLDEEELQEALDMNRITKQDFDLAWRVTDEVLNEQEDIKSVISNVLKRGVYA